MGNRVQNLETKFTGKTLIYNLYKSRMTIKKCWKRTKRSQNKEGNKVMMCSFIHNFEHIINIEEIKKFKVNIGIRSEIQGQKIDYAYFC